MFNIGDKVIVKNNAEELSKEKHILYFNPIMRAYLRQSYAIKDITENATNVFYYKLDCPEVEGLGDWYFLKDWLEEDNSKDIEIDENEIMDMF